ncbi:RING finger protein 10 [Anoplophora glabripennis]|uniref:RING finger protein 10 n=1 Tax=Anoplophora glabripennis TaxID=217634 RepID=UPI000873EB5B|nr:RING finger protein 10 [Anoplophora glabripennis]
MDKKGNRSLPSPKGPAADSKKDVVSKQWPRGSRRREAAGSSLSTKGESSRKPQPQRDRTFDKRPKPRGTYHSCALVRAETAWLEEQEAELGSVFLPGSKKQSLNHLLNFSYTPYSPREGCHSERGRGNGGSGGRMLATKKHKYNKEHFLQANCQFIVNHSGDYKQYLNNPDALVDWDLVEQVNVQVSEFPSCPICLYPPTAAKMTRCGHIYCWSCVLHYLSLSDKPSRKCPICYETVHQNDLKSVVAIPHSIFNVNETITFKLMKRPRGGLTAYPADVMVKDDDVIFNMSEREAGEVYSKLLLANYEDILSIIARECRELKTQIADDENYPEKCFIEQAMALLKERETKVLGKIDSGNGIDKRIASNDCKESNVFDDEVVEVGNLVDSLNISQNANQQLKFHYFYQASDGQHIYLHAINARMLEHTYGSLEFGPTTITGRILEKEGGSMTEELRKRLRYLQHLPVTCQFEVAEIQLRQPVIKKETIEHFQEQIELRRKKRQRRAKEEKRREKRIEAEENRKMGKYPVPNLHLESNDQFPEFGFEARLRTESESTLPSDRSSSPDLLNSSSVSVESTYSGPSFATMLATQKKQPPIWPILKPSSSALEPVKLINVTGSKMKVGNNAQTKNDSDVELEGYEPVPAYNRSFSDAITQALQMVEEKVEDDDIPASGKKKKKRNKQKLLFTTNMAFSGN